MIVEIFGEGRDLTAYQMAARAFVLFFVTLALIRIGGMRAFGRHSSFDSVIVIMLGAVLSRAVVGVSPAIPTITAAVVLVVVHRALAMLTARIRWLEKLVKGAAVPLYRDGSLDVRAMSFFGISRADIEETVRRHGHTENLGEVAGVELEASGELSVLEKQDGEVRASRQP